MKIQILLFVTLLFPPGGLRAAETAIEPNHLQPGDRTPQAVAEPAGTILTFTGDGAAAVELVETFDFRRGGRIDLEFQDDARQTNRFPRLLDSPAVSLHFEAEPNDRGDKNLKALISDAGVPTDAYDQIVIRSPHRPEFWHTLSFVIDPEAKFFCLQLDDGERQFAPLTVRPELGQVRFILGANRLNGSNRAFSGRIRNLKITSPYRDDDARKLAAGKFDRPITAGVRHFTVSAVKNRHHAFPGIARLPNGDLAAVFREGEAHVCPYGRICIVYSKDGGRNWSAPVAVADTASDERDPSIQTLPDGRILLTYTAWNSWMFYDDTRTGYPGESAYIEQAGPENFGGTHYAFSEDGGIGWGAPLPVPAFSPHGPAVAADGTLYQPTLANEDGKRQVYLYRGTPDAKEWERVGLIGEIDNHNGQSPGYEEPHCAILKDGTLVTAIRLPSPGDGYMRISFSQDRGQTWSEPVKTPVRGYPQHLLPLSDGRLLATYGYRYNPAGIRACLSRDGGKTWDIDHEIIIQNNGRSWDIGYPVSLELDDGEVMTVYYNTTRERPDCFIEGAIFRP